jgi:hypothetical protein
MVGIYQENIMKKVLSTLIALSLFAAGLSFAASNPNATGGQTPGTDARGIPVSVSSLVLN